MPETVSSEKIQSPERVEQLQKLLFNLVEISSVTHSEAELEPIEVLGKFFSEHNISWRRVECDKKANLVTEVVLGNGKGPSVLLNSHFDVVPVPESKFEMFEPRREGDTLFGRGVCDAKGSVTAMAIALAEIAETNTKEDVNGIVRAWFVCGEETADPRGTEYF